ncbi:MAG: undecaprenyl/decaprenyl-phosphate alpha-N-acetylglucosaminyl 1-phosphate transferase [Peptococcaceae bacterium]|nr:undecaprenyl/decaprenyl-phosphate alpha-N-acetylglucosaminyl 1-phosphate transferase [Peptococcaceae bacterium]
MILRGFRDLINVLPILAAFLLALALTPWVRSKAVSWGAVDLPNQRKVHRGAMPRLGGLAVYLAFIPAALASSSFKTPVLGLACGATLILLLGMADDIKGVSPRLKLAGQILAALSVVPFGVRVDFVTNPFNNEMMFIGLLAVPVTVFWLVAVTNAVNLIDGLDGLAGGVSCIASLTMAVIALVQFRTTGDSGQLEIMTLSLVLAASVLGFLRYNFHPASIFLGDSGSMLLGFSLGVISVLGLTKSATAISVIIPVVVMGIPLLDVLMAIVRRYQDHRPIFQPDREHLHHQLLARGLSHRQAVLSIYGVSLVMGTSAVMMSVLTTRQSMLLLFLLATLVIMAANKIRVTGPGVKKSEYHAKELPERSSKL